MPTTTAVPDNSGLPPYSNPSDAERNQRSLLTISVSNPFNSNQLIALRTLHNNGDDTTRNIDNEGAPPAYSPPSSSARPSHSSLIFNLVFYGGTVIHLVGLAIVFSLHGELLSKQALNKNDAENLQFFARRLTFLYGVALVQFICLFLAKHADSEINRTNRTEQ